MVHAFRLFHVLIAIAALLAVSAPRPRGRGQVRLRARNDRGRAGSTFRAAIQFTLNEGFHVNSHTPLESFYIPTVVEIAAENGFSARQVVCGSRRCLTWRAKGWRYMSMLNIGLVIEVGADVAPGD